MALYNIIFKIIIISLLNEKMLKLQLNNGYNMARGLFLLYRYSNKGI